MPQMMPLPWLAVFFFIFSCLYSVLLFMSLFSFSASTSLKSFKPHVMGLPW